MNVINRRHFIAVSTAALTFRAAADASRKGIHLPLGIQLHSVADALAADAPGTLRQLREIGYEIVEPAGFGKYTAAEFGKMIRDSGLRAPSAHLLFKDGVDLGPVFAQAKALGVEYATSSVLRSIPADRSPLPPLGLSGFKRIAARMNELGTAAKDAGLKYAYHNHNFEFEKIPDGSFGYDLLLRETDSQLVFLELDCGWMAAAGVSPVDYLRKSPGRYRMLHIKDFKPIPAPTTQVLGPDRPEGTELGSGFVQNKAILAAAAPFGVKYIFAEQEGPYVRPQIESAKASFEYLKALV